ncbi:hypothetical protein K3759_10300 [Sulfitobacter sp. W027]|jgi:hypothetical protein|uniref:hypothetical protein n=1 Tax=Sulfitobacter sp. W027 TaxID=2867025 RepID=UPI0021A4F708|nr:hypothetical protein [Sulfitobacter sp. W027]UWR32354.1 hypothetical protein K3759_10300 [Sulfitobacter sp. W027]|tara:strand:- start:381 stop:539 length:159 start_codon:yes stop_codon:yes gene_type:complete
MKLALTLGALMALTAPSLALASGCDHGKQVMTCAEGMKLDTSSGTCVPDTTA